MSDKTKSIISRFLYAYGGMLAGIAGVEINLSGSISINVIVADLFAAAFFAIGGIIAGDLDRKKKTGGKNDEQH